MLATVVSENVLQGKTTDPPPFQHLRCSAHRLAAMEDIPQPAAEPYQPGDTVRVYLDPDARYHNARVEVVERIEDSLGEETGREQDQYLYRVKDVEMGDVLGVDFRHSDLVPE